MLCYLRTIRRESSFFPPFRSPARRCRCEAGSRRGPERDDGRGLATGGQSSEKGEPADDLSYKRQDMSVQHTHESRQRFARCIRRGEAGVNLAEAALQIAAEDDAIVSHSAVAFPVDAYLGRIQRMVDELARLRLAHLNPDTATPEEFLGVVDKYLYEEQRLGIGGPGKSAIPASAKVAHPGVWEEPRRAYLNELLTRRVGTPAALAILYAEVMQGLLQKVRIGCCFPVLAKICMQTHTHTHTHTHTLTHTQAVESKNHEGKVEEEEDEALEAQAQEDEDEVQVDEDGSLPRCPRLPCCSVNIFGLSVWRASGGADRYESTTLSGTELCCSCLPDVGS